MKTEKQKLGEEGEAIVVKNCNCPKCKRDKSLKRLPKNFKCADLICDFCGYLAQVKTLRARDVTVLPKNVLGVAWGSQKARMEAGIYFPLFVVTRSRAGHAIYYLAADLQPPEMFVARKPLSASARRSGWQGFYYAIDLVKDRMVRLA